MVTANFNTLAYYFQTYGVLDFLLPFILVFTIIYAVSSQIPFLKENKFRAILALVVALLFVAPHVLGTYPLGYDPVEVMNQTLPSISLVAIAAVMMLILLGLFGAEIKESGTTLIGIISFLFVIYIFGSALNFWKGPYDVFSWWTSETTELMIIILIFGLIVWFITSGSSDNSQNQQTKGFEQFMAGLGKFIGGKGGGNQR